MAGVEPLRREELAEFEGFVASRAAGCRYCQAHASSSEVRSVISLFGYLNRWNDTMGTALETEPQSFAERHLTARGWAVGKHAAERVGGV